MPAQEIKELRKSGNIVEALNLAQAELSAEPDNIWAKRNISWVFYEQIKVYAEQLDHEKFLSTLNDIKNLELPENEKMLFDNLSWQIGKMIFGLVKKSPNDILKFTGLFELIKDFHFSKPSEGYSFLLKAFHKAFKTTEQYVQFVDWWNLENLLSSDFQKDKLPNGKDIMSVAEQVYITYAKHLLPQTMHSGEYVFDRDRASQFIEDLNVLTENHPQLQYPPFFQAKLLLALGDKENMLSALLPFAKKKQNDFWVWDILSEAFSEDDEKVFACYCKALSCYSPEEMLVNLRQRMAAALISRKHFNEAKTEIELLTASRKANEYNIPNEVLKWQEEEWYKSANANSSNSDFYKLHVNQAESILYSDVSEELVFVEFVNGHKKMLNFITAENKYGFFKYERFINNINVGDILKVRFQDGSNEGINRVYTVTRVEDDAFRNNFIKEEEGVVTIPSGKNFGFLNDNYIHPKIVEERMMTNGMQVKGKFMKTYNKEKQEISWKMV